MKKQNLFSVRKIKKHRSAKSITRAKRIHPGVAFKVIGLLLLTATLSTFVYFKEQAGEWFKASVLEAPEPFNGTSLPVEKVPNWSQWIGDNKTTFFADISKDLLVDFPAYDESVLSFDPAKLEWKKPEHELIRNTLITYSVVYLGSYKDNHTEGSGSHLAVDIRVPQGTPVHAIANGKVIKASTQSSGFGHHVVIKHIDVPDPKNLSEKITLYSSYSHMDKVEVAEGQNVLKGEIIGTSGNTGTSTTPHLHFQIDRESAGFHPYWPFTWKESQEAGLSFFEAVNAGLGLTNAQENTINPMKFVFRNLKGVTLASADTSSTLSAEKPENNPPQNPTEIPPAISENFTESLTVTSEKALDPSLLPFELSGDGVGMISTGVRVVVKDFQDRLRELGDNDLIPVKVEGVGLALQSVLKKSDFQNRIAIITLKSETPGLSEITVGKSVHSITFVDTVKSAVRLKFEHDGGFLEGETEAVRLIALDENGSPTPALTFTGQIVVSVEEGQASVYPNRLESRDFENGVATLRVKALAKTPLKLRAQNGALVGESDPLTPEDGNLFTDISASHPNFKAIQYLKDKGIINGYTNGTFAPNKTVNRVEALKMLMLAFGAEAGPYNPLPFSDTDSKAWYAATLSAALNKNIVKGYGDGRFRPEQTVNKAEYLKILFNSADVKFEGSLSARPYSDVPVDAWFAQYAYMANQKNIVESKENVLKPSEGMTRAEVAETIYRLKMIQLNHLVTYQK